MNHLASTTLLLTLSLLGGLFVACQPPTPECDCDCDQAVAEAVAKAVAETKMPAAVAAPTRVARPQAARPQGARARGVSSRASGAVSTRPGAGLVVKQPEADRASMEKTFSGFLKAAEARKLGPIAPFLTARLSTVLQQKAAQYEPRFFRGLEETLVQNSSGVEMGETRDAGQGNVEVLFRFGSGHERRVVFFQEDGVWKLNRL